MTSPQLDGFESPTSTDAPFESLEYLTVDSYQWPKSGPPPRKRMAEEERKRRHREIQRQSVARIRARVRSLEESVRTLELQLRVLRARHVAHDLEKQNHALRAELHFFRKNAGGFSVHPHAGASSTELDELADPLLVEALTILTQPLQRGEDTVEIERPTLGGGD